MEHRHSSTGIGGIDVGKSRLDAAIAGSPEVLATGNDAAGIEELGDWLEAHGVGRVGVEATGGYERRLRHELEARGIEVMVHQPLEVSLYARLTRRRAKTDPIDAQLIAAATVALERPRKRLDPALEELAQWLTGYEHIADTVMALKTFRESMALPALAAMIENQIAQLSKLKAALLARLIAALRADPARKARYQLLTSLPGIGQVVAASLLIRMPELGSMEHGQAASLIGVAPHARESGQHKGKRFIAGGRPRPRRMLYLAALTAKRYNPGLKAFATRLANAGKPPKLIVVAVMRKLIEAANLVLKRGQPWKPSPA